MIRLLVDVSLSPAWAAVLTEHGWDAVHWSTVGNLTAADRTVMAWIRLRLARAKGVAAASLMGIDQPTVSALLNGRLANFSSARLMRLLTALGQDVEIVLKARPRSRQRGRIRVVDAHF